MHRRTARKSNTNKKDKDDISERVRQIKQKQENWLKERAEAVSRQSTVASEDSSRESDEDDNVRHSPIQRHSSQFSKSRSMHQRHNDKESFSKFHQWKTRQQIPSNIKNKKAECIDPLQPDQFDEYADEIIHRVKSKIALHHSPVMRESFEQNASDEPEYSELGNQLNESGYGLDSHKCHQCSHIMAPPRYSPKLIIPCGHTYCSQCTDSSKQCPGCKCKIQSVTNNIMLQQIIVQYLQHKKASDSSRSKEKYIPEKYEDRDYEEEYHNLELRKEVFEDETEEIGRYINDIDDQIQKERLQIEGIKHAEKQIMVEIEQLQEKMSDLAQHKLEFKQRCIELEQKKDKKREKLTMVERSMSDIEREMNRVRSLMMSH